MHTKAWREEFSPVSLRATLQGEVQYLEKALAELERLLQNPGELEKMGAGQLHHIMRHFGVEPPLKSQQGERGQENSTIQDWMNSVCENLETTLKDALLQGHFIRDKGVNEELEDQDILYGDMHWMGVLWWGLRRVIFAKQVSEPCRDWSKGKASSWPSSSRSAATGLNSVRSSGAGKPCKG